jgi:regulator of protease activity HflC (stomatin/prohibitin superfamily)
MKKLIYLIAVAITAMACSHVQPGFVGVKVKTLGQNKGVEPVVLGVGRYWMGPLYDLYVYPTSVHIYPFTLAATEGSDEDEAFRFQSIEGINCNVDLAISAHADANKANLLFVTYRKEMEPIIKEYIRQDVSNYLIDYASKLKVEELYSSKKIDMLDFAFDQEKEKVAPFGLILDGLAYKSDIRFPQEVTDAIIGKIKAVQLATQKQNEILQAEADAKKKVATAEGDYQSAVLNAKGNKELAQSVTPQLVQYILAQKWNGVTPVYSGTGSVLPPLFK